MNSSTQRSLFFLIVLSLLGYAQIGTAQTSPTPFMVPDVDNYDFHRKCGFDHHHEKLMDQDPEYANWVKNIREDVGQMVDELQNNNGFVTPPPVINIPVVVHVIHQGEPVGTGPNISDAQIEAQMQVLNDAFAAANVNFPMTPSQWQGTIGNPEINFCLAVLDPNGNATNGITRDNMVITGTDSNNNNIESEIKPATFWNTNLYYNVWVLGIPGTGPGGGVTGWAYLPYNGTIGSNVDGTVVDYNWFGGPGFGQSGDGTLTHESGHYLGLFHPFDGESCAQDDGLADTPNVDAPTSTYTPNLNCSPNNFPTGPSSCGNEHMYVNYMDYVNDDYCQTSFSNDQITVMRAVLNGNAGAYGFGSRLPLASNATAVCTFYGEDAGISAINAPGTFICGIGDITPEVELINFGQNTLTSVTISYEINNGAPIDFSWTGSLLTGQSEVVTLAPYTPPGGVYTFDVYTQLPNGLADGQPSNDSMSLTSVSITPLTLPLLEGFEDPAWNPTINGVFPFNISGDSFEWQRSTAASANGVGTASAMFDNFEGTGGNNPGGTTDALITPIFDFSTVTGGQLTFDVAYTYYDSGSQQFTDTLIVLVSTNCGQNYITQLYVKGGVELSTAPGQASAFTPNATQWRNETIDLSAYDGEDNLSIAFVNFSAWGNRMFIDNINLGGPCSLSSTTAGTDPSCFGACDGIVTVTPANGTAGYTYLWDAAAGDATTATVTGLCAGTYGVTVTDAGACTVENTVTINDPLELTLTASSTDETSANADDGTATANPSGGTMPYTYVWSNAGVTQTITDLTPDIYTVTVTDGNGCTQEATVTVNAFDCSYFTIAVLGTNVTCNGFADGTATASTTTGVPPVTYAWGGGGTTATITDLAPGTFVVIATDANGCTQSGQYTVTEPAALSVTVTTTDETALGADDGTATANPSGGTMPYTYAWSNSGVTQTITDLEPNTYTITVTDANGCTTTASGVVNAFVPDCSSFSMALSGTDVSCNGDANGTATASPTGGATPYVYLWSNAGITQTITGLAPNTYTVTVTDAMGCTLTDQIVITEPIELSMIFESVDVTCAGDCDGTINLEITGGTPPYNFDWNEDALDGQEDPIDLCPGTYIVTITDALGCEISTSIVVDDATPIYLEPEAFPIECNGDCDGAIGFLGGSGTPPYTYLWEDGSTGDSNSGLCAGTYLVTITDANGCSTIQSIPLGELPAIELNVTTTPLSGAGANDGTATATATGGVSAVTYMWDTGATTQTISNLAPGSYTVTVTDGFGCTVTQTVVINPFDCGNFSGSISSTDVACNGLCNGSIELTVSGGSMPFDFDWNDDTLDGTEDPTGLCAGTYEVTITDAAACSIVLSATVNEPAELTVTLTGTPPSAPGANDATLTANPMGGTPGYTYLWAPGGEITQTITNLPPGIYTVTVTDANDCTAEEIIEVVDIDCSNFFIEVTTTDIICSGDTNGTATVTVSGNGTPFTYLWSNGSTTNTAIDLPEGTVSVSVTDANGCLLSESGVIGGPPQVEINLETSDVLCNGGSSGTINCEPSGGTGSGFTFSWSNGSTDQAISNLTTLTYCVTVTDANGCTAEDCTTINEPPALTTITTSTPESLPGAMDGTAEATPSGGTPPYTYNWDNGGTTAIITGLTGGIYTVTVTDANGCTETSSVQVNTGMVDCSSFNMAVSFVESLCNGDNTGSATVTPTGGTPPYTYQWSNGGTTSTITSLIAGTYSVVVTDFNGCQLQQSLTLTEPPPLTATVTTTNESAPGASDGTATCTPLGGIPGYTFLWCDGQATATATGLSAGVCTVVVTDANGCTYAETVTINTNSVDCSGFDAAIATTNVSCFGNSNGVATAIAQGGTNPYTYVWSTGAITATVSNLTANTYTVTVTDTNGCEFITNTTVTEPPALISDATATNETSAGANDGTASANTSGGTPGYTYMWSNGGTTETITDLMPGLYSVTVTDANGCISESSVIVGSGMIDCSSLGAAISGDDLTCFESGDGTATVNVTGGTAPYGYIWSNGMFTQTITGLDTGPYGVTITDINGCQLQANIILTQPSEIVVTATSTDETTAGANDGTASASATGGVPPYTYLWDTGATTQMITDLAPGIYNVVVTDANGCTESIITIVAVGNVDCAGIDLSVSETPLTCFEMNDGVATAAVTGGVGPYAYNWSNGGNTASINGLSVGTYTVTVLDALGCELIGSVSVTQPTELISIVEGNDGACGNGASASVIGLGGTSPYTYLWSNGETGNFVSGLSAGLYTVTVTDAMNCTTSGQVQVQVNSDGISVEQDIDAVTCFGEADGAIDLAIMQGTEPYTFQWSNGATTEDINNLSAGDYSVFITDGAGCSYFTTIEIASPAALDIIFITTPADNGNNGTASAQVYGGTTPYTYNWDTGHQDIYIDGLSTGTYTLTVTDANGCTYVETVGIGVSAIDDIESLLSFELMPNPSDGHFQVAATFNKSEQVEVQVYSIVGQLVFERQVEANTLQMNVDISSMAKGTYLLRMRVGEGTLVRKLLVF